MKDLKLVCELMVVLLLCSLVCTMSSCHKEEDSVAEETAFRTMLRGLDWGTDTCFVYGHRTPDVDAVTSALAYAKLMRTLGYNCKAKVSSTMNRETEYIARVFGITLPELKDSVVPQRATSPMPAFPSCAARWWAPRLPSSIRPTVSRV